MPDVTGERIRIVKWNVEAAGVYAGSGSNNPIPNGYVEFHIPEAELAAFREELLKVFDLVKDDKDV